MVAKNLKSTFNLTKTGYKKLKLEAEQDFAYAVACEMHERNRGKLKGKDDNGGFCCDWRIIKDKKFVAKLNAKKYLPEHIRFRNGNFEMDIAHSTYDELSPDLQFNDREFGKTAAGLVRYNEHTENKLTEKEIGTELQNKWFEMYPYLKNDPYYGVPFEKLPDHNQKLILEKYQIALDVNEKLKLKEQGITDKEL